MLGAVKAVSEGLGQKMEFSCAGRCNWFMEQWLQLSLHQPDSLSQAHTNAANSANLAEYFVVLENSLKENNLMNCPRRT